MLPILDSVIVSLSISVATALRAVHAPLYTCSTILCTCVVSLACQFDSVGVTVHYVAI